MQPKSDYPFRTKPDSAVATDAVGRSQGIEPKGVANQCARPAGALLRCAASPAGGSCWRLPAHELRPTARCLLLVSYSCCLRLSNECRRPFRERALPSLAQAPRPRPLVSFTQLSAAHLSALRQWLRSLGGAASADGRCSEAKPPSRAAPELLETARWGRVASSRWLKVPPTASNRRPPPSPRPRCTSALDWGSCPMTSKLPAHPIPHLPRLPAEQQPWPPKPRSVSAACGWRSAPLRSCTASPCCSSWRR